MSKHDFKGGRNLLNSALFKFNFGFFDDKIAHLDFINCPPGI